MRRRRPTGGGGGAASAPPLVAAEGVVKGRQRRVGKGGRGRAAGRRVGQQQDERRPQAGRNSVEPVDEQDFGGRRVVARYRPARLHEPDYRCRERSRGAERGRVPNAERRERVVEQRARRRRHVAEAQRASFGERGFLSHTLRRQLHALRRGLQGGGWWQGCGATAQSYATELRWATSGATARAAQMYSPTPSVLMLRSSSRTASSRGARVGEASAAETRS